MNNIKLYFNNTEKLSVLKIDFDRNTNNRNTYCSLFLRNKT